MYAHHGWTGESFWVKCINKMFHDLKPVRLRSHGATVGKYSSFQIYCGLL